MTDFKHGKCGFSVSFVGTNETTSFTWKEVIARRKETTLRSNDVDVYRNRESEQKASQVLRH